MAVGPARRQQQAISAMRGVVCALLAVATAIDAGAAAATRMRSVCARHGTRATERRPKTAAASSADGSGGADWVAGRCSRGGRPDEPPGAAHARRRLQHETHGGLQLRRQ
eukprot:363984-Chlamydomonas_euryale.AAC.31